MMKFRDDKDNELLYVRSPSNPIKIDGVVFSSVNIVKTETRFIRIFVDSAIIHTVNLPIDLLNVSLKRRSEFLAGRLCCALNLICFDAPIYVGRADRRPIWPNPYVGSLSHTDNDAVAITSKTHKSLGIDLATILQDDIAREVQHLICTGIDFKKRPPRLTLPEYITLVLSAKESLFKAISNKLCWVPSLLDCNVVDIDHSTVSLEFMGVTYKIDWAISQNNITTICKF
jgi:enterobactin synthetase component D